MEIVLGHRFLGEVVEYKDGKKSKIRAGGKVDDLVKCICNTYISCGLMAPQAPLASMTKSVNGALYA